MFSMGQPAKNIPSYHDNEEWDTLTEPGRSWFNQRLGELRPNHNLTVLIVRRDFVSVYKQTI